MPVREPGDDPATVARYFSIDRDLIEEALVDTAEHPGEIEQPIYEVESFGFGRLQGDSPGRAAS